MFKLKNISFILIVFFAISCDDDMKDFKYRKLEWIEEKSKQVLRVK